MHVAALAAADPLRGVGVGMGEPKVCGAGWGYVHFAKHGREAPCTSQPLRKGALLLGLS